MTINQKFIEKHEKLSLPLIIYSLSENNIKPVEITDGFLRMFKLKREDSLNKIELLFDKIQYNNLINSLKDLNKNEELKNQIMLLNGKDSAFNCRCYIEEFNDDKYIFVLFESINELTKNFPANITVYETVDGEELGLLRVSEYYSEMLGMDNDVHYMEMKDGPYKELFCEDEIVFKKEIKESIKNGDKDYERVLRYWNRKTNSYKHVKIMIKIVRTLSSKVLLFINHIDVDLQYQAEKNLLLAIKFSEIQYMEWNFVNNTVSIREYSKKDGYRRTDIKDFYSKKKLNKLIHKTYVDEYYDELTNLIEGGKDQTVIDNICLNSDGIYEWQRHNLIVTERDNNGRPINIVGTTSPINEQKEIEERLNTISTQYGLTTWVYYPDKKVGKIINSIGGKYDNAIYENFPWSFLKDNKIHEEDYTKIDEAYKRIEAGEKNVEYTMRLDSGRGYRWLEINHTNVYNDKDEIIYAVGSSRDITEEMNLRKEYYDTYDLYKNINKETTTATIVDLNENEIISAIGDSNIFYKYPNMIFDDALDTLASFAIQEEDSKWLLKFKRLSALELYNLGERNFTREIKFAAPEGQLYFIESVRLIKNPENGNVMMFFTANDITKNYEIDSFLKFIASNRYDFAAIVNLSDPSYNYIYYYPDTLSEIKYSTVHGKDFFNEGKKRLIKYLGNTDAEKIIENINPDMILKKLNENEEYTYIYHREKDGVKYTKKMVFKYYDKDEHKVGIIQQDVTEDFKTEEKRRQILSEAFDEAKKANDIKNEFLGRMSHDMRTPMNAIIGMSEFGLLEIKDENAKEYFSQIKASSSYLMGLLNDILDMQKLENGNIELHKEIANLNDCMINNTNIIKVRSNEKGIDLETNFNNDIDLKYINVDTLRLNQVLLNVLNNAIKYTQIGGKVTWNAEFLLTKNGYILNHTITDNGIGMSEKFLEDLYTPFVRANSDFVSENEGIGLGLAISKKLVDTMGGTMDCRSQLGKGTTFNINLPIEVPSEKEVKKHLSKSNVKLNCENNLIGKRILLCEDVEINSKIVKKMLYPFGVIITVAENGKIGLELMEKNKYDLVLMDIHMPIMNGLEATKKIREFDKRTPIVALSANAYNKDIENSLKSGMNTHLSKPVNRNELLNEIFKLVI